jgi:hypothetical protein
MSKNLPDNPFREKSASHRLYAVLAKATKPLTVKAISERTKVPLKKAATLVHAYQNHYHNAPLRRIGARIESKDGEFTLTTAKPEAKAQRPARGEGKKKAVGKLKTAPKKAKAKGSTKEKKPCKPKSDAASVPVPVPEPAEHNVGASTPKL